MREYQIAQNTLRIGRDGRGAAIVLDTAAYPEWLPVEGATGDVSLWSPSEHQGRDAVRAVREGRVSNE